MALTDVQRAAAERIAAGDEIEDIARYVDVGRSTIYRWARTNEEFRSLVVRIAREVEDRAIMAARHNVGQTVGEVCTLRRLIAARLNISPNAEPQELPSGDVRKLSVMVRDYLAVVEKQQSLLDSYYTRRIMVERWDLEMREREAILRAEHSDVNEKTDSEAAGIPDNGRAD